MVWVRRLSFVFVLGSLVGFFMSSKSLADGCNVCCLVVTCYKNVWTNDMLTFAQPNGVSQIALQLNGNPGPGIQQEGTVALYHNCPVQATDCMNLRGLSTVNNNNNNTCPNINQCVLWGNVTDLCCNDGVCPGS